jgi:hypothetical protein
VRADDEAEARALIAKSIEAAGGAANLAKHNALTWKEKHCHGQVCVFESARTLSAAT